MAQGWTIDQTAGTITFLVAPPTGTNNVLVKEYGAAARNATDVWAYGAWNPGFGYPAEVEFYSDRLIFAASRTQPQTMWMSKTGSYVDHGHSTPVADSDAISLTINARQINTIKELVPLSDLIVMTTSGEWRLTTGSDEVVAPGKVGFKPQSYHGCNGLPAQVSGNTGVFVQSRGRIVRDISFDFTQDGYVGNNLTVYASHLVEGFEVVDIAYQQEPYTAVWLVRDDGKLISLTYLREQEVVGWALHYTDGIIEAVCTVPEGSTNAVYVTVRRFIDGAWATYVERLAERDLEDQRDAFFVDSGLTYDGRIVTGTQTLTGGTNWEHGESLTLTASTAQWVGAGDVGDQVRLVVPALYGDDGELETPAVTCRMQITDYVSATVVTVTPETTVPAALRGVAVATWELLRDTIAGLDHLEGKTVAVLADAEVQGEKVVAGGQITLDYPAAVVQAGLGYRSMIESLDINVPGQATVRDRPKLISKVGLVVKDTRGLKCGPDTSLLDEFKVREFEDYEDAQALVTGLLEVNTSNTWDKNGRFVVVQDDPLPATIESLIPDVSIAGVG